MRQIESRDSGTERDERPVESRDNGTVPGLSGILVPKCRDLLSRVILVAGPSRRFLSRSRLSRGFVSGPDHGDLRVGTGIPTLSLPKYRGQLDLGFRTLINL